MGGVSLLVNELSFHGQFADLATFRAAISRIMTIRGIARRYGRELYCHKGMAYAQVTAQMTMPQAVQSLNINEQRALRSWMSQAGPFWEDARVHSPDEWLELDGSIVTDTAIGEAAWCGLHSIERELISASPSNWLVSPLSVEWISSSGERHIVGVRNHWEPFRLEEYLQAAPTAINSWKQLGTCAIARCPLLTFSNDAFTPLDGHPFSSSAAERVLSLLCTLNRFKSCFDANGERTAEGHEIYQDFFTGVKEGGGRGAMFSDSSDGEKDEFRKQLTFKHPGDVAQTLFCTWHGKVQTPQLRVHFSWPVRSNEPFYIVYAGPKLTKR